MIRWPLGHLFLITLAQSFVDIPVMDSKSRNLMQTLPYSSCWPTSCSRVLVSKLVGSHSRQIPRILWNQNFCCRIHNTPPPNIVLCRINAATSYFCNIHFNIIHYHLLLNVPNNLFSSVISATLRMKLWYLPCLLYGTPCSPALM
jgi:hypothetical protein